MQVLQETMAQFPEISGEEWKQKIEKDLKGKTYNDLIRHTEESIDILPFYTKDSIHGQILTAVPYRTGDCKNALLLRVNEEEEANKQALSDLQYGLDAILYFKEEFSENEKSILANDIDTQAVELIYLDNKNCIVVNDTSSLSVTLADALRALTQQEVQEKETLYFVFSASQNYFFDMAKFRAFRWLIAQIEKHNSIPLHYKIIAQTGSGNRGDEFVYNSILRNTTEAMSAVLGGADYVCVQPHVIADENAKRIGINIHHILQYESYFSNLPDVGKGCYYIEYLSYHLAKKAWELL